MPKVLSYPQASFRKAYELAETVDLQGGTCSIEDCAQQLNKKVSGGFMMIVSAAQKFSLIEVAKGIITISDNFRSIKRAYSDEGRLALLRKAFLSPSLFYSLYQRFIGKELPIKLLSKVMIHDFGIDESVAGRISGYFIDGLTEFGLVDAGNIVRDVAVEGLSDVTKTNKSGGDSQLKPGQVDTQAQSAFKLNVDKGFTVHIYGPGLDNRIKIDEVADLKIVEATLEKIRRVLGESKISFSDGH